MRTFSTLAALLAAFALCACQNAAAFVPQPAAARAASGTSNPALDTASIDKIVEESDPQHFGIALGIYRDGKLLYAKGYGQRDFGRTIGFAGVNFWNIPQPDKVLHLKRGVFPPDPQTIFDVGSVSKEFTAGAILLLQQDKKLSVNDKLSKWFPKIQLADKIPLLWLLQHRTGFVDYNYFGGTDSFLGAYDTFLKSGEKDYTAITNRFESLSSPFVRDPQTYPPGTYYYYSNTDYLLLGMIVSKAGGMPLGDFLERRVFTPLGMSQTHQGYPPLPAQDFALGYQLGPNSSASSGSTVYRAWQWNLPWLAGAGGLTSTIGDIALWDEAVHEPGKLFSAQSIAQMFRKSPIANGGDYADGWVVQTLDGYTFIWHNGAVGGYQAMNATFPQLHLDIVILTNNGNGDFDVPGYGYPYTLVPKILTVVLQRGAF